MIVKTRDKTKMGYIYLDINQVNGKIYIGQHNGKNSSYLGSGTIFRRAIRKYGQENFTKVILENNIEDADTLNKRETDWIALYDSTNPDIGYNLTKGGGGTLGYEWSQEQRANKSGENNPMYQKDVSPETRKRLSMSGTGIKRTPQWRERLSLSKTGNKNPNFGKCGELNHMYGKCGELAPMYGKKHTLETREKMSKVQKGKNLGRKASNETRAKQSTSHKEWYQRGGKHAMLGLFGADNPNYGSHRTPEQNINNSNAQKARFQKEREKKSIKTICAWCSVILLEGVLIDSKVSHGCCEDCKRKVLKND